MPYAAKKCCSYPGCPALTDGGRCPKHKQQSRREQDARRGSAHSRGYTQRWARASRAFLLQNPICADPFGDHGERFVAAECTDHIKPHRGDVELFWDYSNWQPLCLRCNSKKAAKEEGGFGNHARI